MKFIILVALLAGCMAQDGGDEGNGGRTLPAGACPENSACTGRAGSFALSGYPSWIHVCDNGHSICMPCATDQLVFSEDCQQCLNSAEESCTTTEPWTPAPPITCNEDACDGNVDDDNVPNSLNPNSYAACFGPHFIACMPCPSGLVWNDADKICDYPPTAGPA